MLDALLLPGEPRNEGVGVEGQVLLMRGLARLERQNDVDAAVAWSLDERGDPTVIAAHPADAARRIEPTHERYRALATLERVQRLTDASLTAPPGAAAPPEAAISEAAAPSEAAASAEAGAPPGATPLAASRASSDRVATEFSALCSLGVSAVAPVPGLGSTPSAILLVYPEKAGRPLRPRTIAVLAEVAQKLEKALSTSLALDRMARLDGAVQHLDRLAALGGLVSEIVHEIRNPLVSMKTFLQLLPDRLEDPEFHNDFRGLVEDEVGRLERMLEDLLRHARPTPVEAPIEPAARIDDAVGTTLQLMTYRCRERGIELDAQLREELPSLGVPPDALRQLLLNLMLNATEVTPSGGKILISADWSEAAANQVEIRVEDEGPGVDPDVSRRVFDPFWTTRPDGTGGLGLAICKRIVDDANGEIVIENASGGGARFRITLPITR